MSESELAAESLTASSNPPRTGIRKGIYIVPSVFTIANIMCGFYAVINAVQAFQLGTEEKATELFDSAAIAVGFAFLFDGLDGRIARMTKTTSEFGVELDSIADVVTFGIAPAVLAYTWGFGQVAGLGRIGWAVSFVFLICGALRLARFNVMARAPKFVISGGTPKLDKRYFVGLPIPAAAGVLAAVIHFRPEPFLAYSATTQRWLGWALILSMAALAALMVSTLRYTSFKNVGSQRANPFIALPLVALLIAAIWYESQTVLLAMGAGYVVHGPLLKLLGLFGRLRRVNTPTATVSPMTVESERQAKS